MTKMKRENEGRAECEEAGHEHILQKSENKISSRVQTELGWNEVK